MKFEDRRHAGRLLADALKGKMNGDALVLALPRGGVPVGFEVARALGLPLDVFVARKVGAPGHPEFGIGAVAPGGVRVIDERSARAVGATEAQIEETVARELDEVDRRLSRYRGDRPYPRVEGRTVILVDDGIATGVTARAAVQALKSQSPHALVVAVPVAPRESVAELAREADDVVALETPDPFHAVGAWYVAFDQTTDEEVESLLREARSPEVTG